MSAKCPRCGVEIPAEAPQGLCPKCILQQASFPTETGPGTRHSRPAPPSREELAAAFPNLEILELIGQGGMGFVFKARQPKLDRLVALKILAQPLAEQASFAERFTREGRTLAKLNHPKIVTIYDFGQAGPFFYLLMEYVDGVNLRQAMRAGRITPDEALAIVPKICEALQYAHTQGVLHRDIKPDNILIDTRGEVKIADFGIAKLMAEAAAENPLTGSGATLGTPHYMAPEQIERPNLVDHRADIYSLGVVFYEMLTGELPLGRFAAPSEKSGGDPRLDKLVFQTLEKEPHRRQQSAQEVRTQVEGIATTPKVEQKARGYGGLLLKIFIVLFVVFIVLPFSFYLLRKRKVQPEAEPAQLMTASTPSRSLTADKIMRDGRAIYLISSSKVYGDEEIEPVLRYGNGSWVTNEATALEQNWISNRFQQNWYIWRIPEPFTPEFDVAAAVQEMRSSQQTIGLQNEGVTPLFTVVNGQGQSISGGLRYTWRPRELPENTIAFLMGRNGRGVGSTPGPPIFQLEFTGELPSGTWLESSVETTLTDAITPKVVVRKDSKEIRVQYVGWAAWPMAPILEQTQRRTIELPLGKRVRIFSLTNFTGDSITVGTFRSFKTGEERSTNIESIVTGYLELKPIGVNRNE